MLDPDDRVGDVCDDREQLEAIFDEQDGANLGDGMASSDSEAERETRDREANAVVERANAALGLSQQVGRDGFSAHSRKVRVVHTECQTPYSRKRPPQSMMATRSASQLTSYNKRSLANGALRRRPVCIARGVHFISARSSRVSQV